MLPVSEKGDACSKQTLVESRYAYGVYPVVDVRAGGRGSGKRA